MPKIDTDPMRLTGDDVALCVASVQMAMTWWKDKPRTTYRKNELARLNALLSKLNQICDIAYPYDTADDMPLSVGSEPIMKMDARVVDKTRERALPNRAVQ